MYFKVNCNFFGVIRFTLFDFFGALFCGLIRIRTHVLHRILILNFQIGFMQLTNKMGTQISKEELNYIKLVMLLTQIAPRAVRSYFDGKIRPDSLQQTLHNHWNTLQKTKSLNKTQKKLVLHPKGWYW